MPHSQLCRKAMLLATACIAFACSLAAQTAPAPARPPAFSTSSFDVATIKPHEGILTITGLINRPDGLRAAADTLADMMTSAYGVRTEDQVSGGPEWVKSDRYDVEAKMSAEDAAEFQKLSPDAMKERRRQMLRALLEDRFHLQTHFVTKEIPAYELVVAKGGPKLKDAATDTDEHVRKGPDGKPIAGVMWFLKDTCTAQGYTIASLANMLSQPFAGVGRPVLDKTGLTGTYNFTLDWSPQMKAMPGGAATASAPSEDMPSIFTALQELGLKLQPATGPEKIVVIDHVERPSEN
jgi:uncharacterized protein (TIGR03435 family)